MWKIGVVAVLLFNGGITLSYPSKYDASSYDGRENDGRFNLLQVSKNERESEHSRRETTEPAYLENWTGAWFPHKPGDPTPPPKIWPSAKHISNPRPWMGKPSDCDNGKTKLEVHSDKWAVNYTCYEQRIEPDVRIGPMVETVVVPPAYRAAHRRMNETIEYDEDLPVFGAHRPAYPVYGEYKFLPKQIWLHSLEHGAVVALYHPCANPLEIGRLKKMVKQCLRRHIISPYESLDRQRPLALLAWGSRLTMAYVNPEIVRDFIRGRSLQGPENIPTDGEFDEGLVSKALVVSDADDSTLCPNM